MRCAEVKYTIRKTLGNYEHEELSAVVVSEEGDLDTHDDMMREARRICAMHLTSYLKRKGDEDDK